MSEHWYRALVNMWQRYWGEPWLAGVGLQQQTYTAAGAAGASHDTNISALAAPHSVLYRCSGVQVYTSAL